MGKNADSDTHSLIQQFVIKTVFFIVDIIAL